MTSTDAIAAENAFVLITEQVRDQANAFFDDYVDHHGSKHDGLFRGSSSTTVRGWTTSLSCLFLS